MVSIIVYTKPEVLQHKQGKLPNDPDYSDMFEYYWALGDRCPKNLDPETDKIYFATKGFIRGSFEIIEIEDGDITFDARTWKDIKPIPCKPFQGFKYADKVKELSEVKPDSSQE